MATDFTDFKSSYAMIRYIV